MTSNAKKALVIAEQKNGSVIPASFEALECARMFCGGLEKVKAMILGGEIDGPASELAGQGVDVFAVSGPNLGSYNCELFCRVLFSELKSRDFDFICMAHTSMGMDVASYISVKLKAAYAPGVESFSPERGAFSRPVYNGKLTAEIRPDADKVVCTVLPGSFSWEKQEGAPGSVESVVIHDAPEKTTSMGVSKSEGPDLSLAQAETIICAGRGMGGPENMDLIQKTASLFPRSAVAGSRIACDLGWLLYNQQVGVTGQTVAPRFYMACGVSGAFQHVVGMKGSQLIAAVNTDPNAPIFQIADYCIIEDALEFLPVFFEEATQ